MVALDGLDELPVAEERRRVQIAGQVPRSCAANPGTLMPSRPLLTALQAAWRPSWSGVGGGAARGI